MIFKKRKKSLQERYPQYQIGRDTYGDPTIHASREGASLRVGSFTSIAYEVQIFLGGEHRIDWVTTFPFNVLWEEAKHISGHPKTKGNVVIGHDVWIGVEAIILSGVTIGDRSKSSGYKKCPSLCNSCRKPGEGGQAKI
jgi:chloramphenicol O-acetyltransferase type B